MGNKRPHVSEGWGSTPSPGTADLMRILLTGKIYKGKKLYPLALAAMSNREVGEVFRELWRHNK